MKIFDIPIEIDEDKDIPKNEIWFCHIKKIFINNIIKKFKIPILKVKNINIEEINPDIERKAEKFIATIIEAKTPSLIEIEGYAADIKKDDIITINNISIGYPPKGDYKVISVRKKKYGITKLKLRRIKNE